MSASPLVRAAVRGLFAGLAAAAASCGGTQANAPALDVPVEPVKPTPLATVPTPPSKVEPVVTKPVVRQRDYDCCRGKNDCKGQSGCATSFNDCAGMNDCKGKGTACPREGDR